ncbi:MAG: transcriptional regulator GlxA family with amidase domain [Gammaproteobacteria bacterium]|jgi:transcriptional regulator GlxA family with amidase domain
MKFGLLLYEGVEPIDLATIGVVSMARRIIPELEYLTIGLDASPVTLSNGLRVLADFTISDEPSLDILIVPGGPGWKAASEHAGLLNYLRMMAPNHSIASVCTGAMLLASAGLLDGKAATTKVEVVPPEQSPLHVLQHDYPAIGAEHALIVDEGRIITGGGVSLCIDMMLYLIERDFGADKAEQVARIMEYGSARRSNSERLALVVNA